MKTPEFPDEIDRAAGLKRVRKVVAYITCEDRLLVFTHRDFPEVGVQVPAGTVEPDEDLAEAALREAAEETGLDNLEMVRYLGMTEFDASVLRPELHERHFYHLRAPAPVRESWLHFEMTPSGGDRTPIAYEIFWVKLDAADLFFDFGARLKDISL